jgi:hypothetical protein
MLFSNAISDQGPFALDLPAQSHSPLLPVNTMQAIRPHAWKPKLPSQEVPSLHAFSWILTEDIDNFQFEHSRETLSPEDFHGLCNNLINLKPQHCCNF